MIFDMIAGCGSSALDPQIRVAIDDMMRAVSTHADNTTSLVKYDKSEVLWLHFSLTFDFPDHRSFFLHTQMANPTIKPSQVCHGH